MCIFGFFVKPNYFDKQRSLSSFLLRPEVDMQVQNSHVASTGYSPLSKMDRTRLQNTPWPLWTCISTSGK